MLSVVVVNRLLRNMGRQSALLPGQGGQLNGHVADLGGVGLSSVEGGGREGGRTFRGQKRERVKRRNFCQDVQGM
jgi:hypothetical protein